MSGPPSRSCGYFWTALIGSADGETVELTFPTISGWSGRPLRVPACITRMLPPDSGVMSCIIAPGHSPETLNGRVRDLRGPSGYEGAALLVRGHFAAGRVTAVRADRAEVEWVQPAAPPSTLPVPLFLTPPEPGEFFELGGGPIRQPQTPHWD